MTREWTRTFNFAQNIDFVLGSDGVWDKVPPQEALAYILQQRPDQVQQAAHNLASVENKLTERILKNLQREQLQNIIWNF